MMKLVDCVFNLNCYIDSLIDKNCDFEYCELLDWYDCVWLNWN